MRRRGLGALTLIAGIAIFSVQDPILKHLSGTYPLHQAMVIRSLTAAPLLLLLVHLGGGLGRLLTPGWRGMVARGLVSFVSYSSYYLGIAALPIATNVALYFTAPLFITAMSAALLGERVAARRWLAVIVGFAGVLAVARPGGALFDWAVVLPLVSGAAYALSMISARLLGVREGAAAMAFYGNGVFLVGAVLLSLALGGGGFAAEEHRSLAFLLRGWVRPSAGDLALMAACGVVAALGLTLLIQAYRMAEAASVAPFEYTALIWGLAYGWLWWREWPDPVAWAGIAVIVAGGVYLACRDRAAEDGAAGP